MQQGDKTICDPLLRLQDLQAEEPKGQDDGVFRLDRGVLYKINPTTQGKKFLPAIPSSLRREIIQSCHDSPTGGHFGVEKTRAKVAERYWWPGLTTSCQLVVCQLNKHPTGLTEGMLQPIQSPSRPMQQYGMDHVGPFERTAQGNRYILAAIDLLSKYVIAKAMPDTTANNAIKFFHEEIIGHHGFPKKNITDRGTVFTVKAFAKALEDWGIRHTWSSTAHPQSNGQVERNHRNLITALKAFVNPAENDWDEKVTGAVVAINRSYRRHQSKKKEESMATISSTRQPDKTVQNTQGCGVRNSTARPASGGDNNSRKKNKKWPPSQTSGSMASTVKWMDVNRNNSGRQQSYRPHHYPKIMSYTLVILFICCFLLLQAKVRVEWPKCYGRNLDYSNDA